jgi:hypothetical protein
VGRLSVRPARRRAFATGWCGLIGGEGLSLGRNRGRLAFGYGKRYG